MSYWLYYTAADIGNYTKRPLITGFKVVRVFRPPGTVILQDWAQ